MNLSSRHEWDDLYREKLVEALCQDIRTSKHAGEVNYQVLGATLSLLKSTEGYLDLSLEQLMIGTMNMAVCLQISKYGNISAESVGEAVYKKYLSETEHWFVGYNEALKTKGPLVNNDAMEIAIPVIKRAAQSCLYITPCVPNTLNLYFEYLQKLNDEFVGPKIPTGNTFSLWRKEQFVSFNTIYSSSLLNLSLFAVKKHKLSPDKLSTNLIEKLNNLAPVNEKSNQDIQQEMAAANSSCTII
jgi:hypothetical protein